MNIKTFYARPSADRDRYKAGILIEPLPDVSQILIDKIARALKVIGIECIHFIITDAFAVSKWCSIVGVGDINGMNGILGIWILDKDPEVCIQVVREVVKEHINNA